VAERRSRFENPVTACRVVAFGEDRSRNDAKTQKDRFSSFSTEWPQYFLNRSSLAEMPEANNL
jgi:hypothetical protein